MVENDQGQEKLSLLSHGVECILSFLAGSLTDDIMGRTSSYLKTAKHVSKMCRTNWEDVSGNFITGQGEYFTA